MATTGLLAYSTSKDALNMLTVQYAKALPHMRVNAADPGWTATDINANEGPQTAAQGAERISAMAQIDRSGPTGTYSDRHGELAW